MSSVKNDSCGRRFKMDDKWTNDLRRWMTLCWMRLERCCTRSSRGRRCPRSDARQPRRRNNLLEALQIMELQSGGKLVGIALLMSPRQSSCSLIRWEFIFSILHRACTTLVRRPDSWVQNCKLSRGFPPAPQMLSRFTPTW